MRWTRAPWRSCCSRVFPAYLEKGDRIVICNWSKYAEHPHHGTTEGPDCLSDFSRNCRCSSLPSPELGQAFSCNPRSHSNELQHQRALSLKLSRVFVERGYFRVKFKNCGCTSDTSSLYSLMLKNLPM